MSWLIKLTVASIIMTSSMSSRAEVISYSGGFIKPANGASITESMGCFFSSFQMPVDPPNDAVINGITLYTYSIATEPEFRIVKLFKHYQDNPPETLINHSYDVDPGFSSVFISSILKSPVEAKEFLNLSSSSESGVCGIKVHYEIDLIFKADFN